jgi:hypothetical protein
MNFCMRYSALVLGNFMRHGIILVLGVVWEGILHGNGILAYDWG